MKISQASGRWIVAAILAIGQLSTARGTELEGNENAVLDHRQVR